ncbi:MAG: prepilin-type N-terminal cleavage/methylation domain-containing protein [Armatimonadota bacterium]|nr:prepilin-type N-terminal cleavage/methylation domain-containing protein [Armatimonadota bacterium]MDW8142443.1 prepilin-type N-terminal cleavage/methylation domain-containing protein [Armatimonadota bacterium]
MRKRRGLTLVELVVVMVLLLFIGLSVGGLVRTVKDTEQSINRTSEMNQTGRIVLQRIASELSSALPLPVVLDETQATLTTPTEISGLETSSLSEATTSVLTFYHEDASDIRSGLDLDTLRFTTANADPRRSSYPQADTIEVAYYIDTDPQTPAQGLVRSVGTLPGLLPEDVAIEQAQPEILSDRVVSLNFRFYDPDTGEWLDTWDYTDVLPPLVEITIGVAPSPCDEFMAQLERDRTAISFVEWLTTTVPIRVRSYPDPSVQQQQEQQQTSSMSGMQQIPQSQQRPQTPTAPQTTPQIPQQSQGTNLRPQQGGGQR